MEFLDLSIRPDWQQVRWQHALQRTRRWRFTRMAVIISTLASGLWMLWAPRAQARWSLAQILLGPALLGGVVVWHVFREQERSKVVLLGAMVVLVVESVIAYGTQPDVVYTFVSQPWSSLLTIGSVLLPAIAGIALNRLATPEDRTLRQLGLHSDEWVPNLLIGLALGGAFGFHLLLSMSGSITSSAFSLATVYIGLWTFCYHLGFYTLIQELLFRGLAYVLRFEGNETEFWKTAMEVVFLNTLCHLRYILQNAPSFGVGLGWLSYQMVIASVSLFLFIKRRSILPCLALSVTFNIFIALAWQ